MKWTAFWPLKRLMENEQSIASKMIKNLKFTKIWSIYQLTINCVYKANILTGPNSQNHSFSLERLTSRFGFNYLDDEYTNYRVVISLFSFIFPFQVILSILSPENWAKLSPDIFQYMGGLQYYIHASLFIPTFTVSSMIFISSTFLVKNKRNFEWFKLFSSNNNNGSILSVKSIDLIKRITSIAYYLTISGIIVSSSTMVLILVLPVLIQDHVHNIAALVVIGCLKIMITSYLCSYLIIFHFLFFILSVQYRHRFYFIRSQLVATLNTDIGRFIDLKLNKILKLHNNLVNEIKHANGFWKYHFLMLIIALLPLNCLLGYQLLFSKSIFWGKYINSFVIIYALIILFSMLSFAGSINTTVSRNID